MRASRWMVPRTSLVPRRWTWSEGRRRCDSYDENPNDPFIRLVIILKHRPNAFVHQGGEQSSEQASRTDSSEADAQPSDEVRDRGEEEKEEEEHGRVMRFGS
jgi:hypothetical protein